MRVILKEGVCIPPSLAIHLYGEGSMLEDIVDAFAKAMQTCAPGHDVVITSCLDGTHSEKSLHYKARAIDFRRFGLTMDEMLKVQQHTQKLLGPDFDVVLETDHFHIEYDPKGLKET